jgi:hypothetical protein
MIGQAGGGLPPVLGGLPGIQCMPELWLQEHRHACA